MTRPGACARRLAGVVVVLFLLWLALSGLWAVARSLGWSGAGAIGMLYFIRRWTR